MGYNGALIVLEVKETCLQEATRPTIASDAQGEKLYMLGNEAIARGAIEAGVQVAAAYPGTPSSEILETLAEVAGELGIYAEWSVNEKVAFEVALAASICGLRALASMKHVGVNVAHDSLMTASYMGAKGGLVLVAADDPWMWSSQNEQDSRYVAEQAYVPVLEPSSVQEAKDMMASAFGLSEQFGQVFMFRSVTRIGHGRSDVVLGEISRTRREASFEKNPARMVYTPAVARKNKPLMLERFARIRHAVNELPFNQLRLAAGAKLGVVASGLSYAYVVEALNVLDLNDRISMLKIGTPHPLPAKLVSQLLLSVEEVLVVEELEPFVETHIKALAQESGITLKVHGKDMIPLIGELSTRAVIEAIGKLANRPIPTSFAVADKLAQDVAGMIPLRPPALCPGCPHRASNYVIKIASKRVARDYGDGVEPIYPSDIGCYTLANNPPLESVDSVICMGGSFGIANGLAHVLKAPIVAHLGDSTFFHSGIPPLINAVYNKARITMLVLDNSATAMTGFQPHPGTGNTATGEITDAVKIEDVARACGVKFVEVADPFDLKMAIEVLEKAMRFDGPAVVVMRSPCVIVLQREKKKKGEAIVPYRVLRVLEDRCNEKCNTCVALLGCPAILKQDGKKVIDASMCPGCGLCSRVCPYKAIVQE
ncbi:MAG: indolepyruvate ferredoxin oxidoreductase subunit alpha [Chloroflexi bacterium]|nr:indolepyruvate ferredoxin oxidoreductase subunit alpha [Chloroflexota bacterium]